MNKSKIVLLTASFMLAFAFFGCSGNNGTNGERGGAGTSCTMKAAEEAGYDFAVFCGNEFVGYLNNGEQGLQGIQGEQGAKGDVGAGCDVAEDGAYFVMTCGGEEKARWAKAMCGDKVFDPNVEFCNGSSIIDKCGGEIYDADMVFCASNVIYDKCGGESYDLDTEFCDYRDDGKIYKWVEIGEQTWMAENLNYRTATGSYCYGNNNANCEIYGRLYDWATAMSGATSSTANPSGVQGICPSGWHLPSRAEWGVLETYAGGASTAGTKLKATSGWGTGNGTDNYGFSAVPGGNRNTGGSFYDVGSDGYWWSATEYSGANAYYRHVSSSDAGVYVSYINKAFGFSVRCVRD